MSWGKFIATVGLFGAYDKRRLHHYLRRFWTVLGEG